MKNKYMMIILVLFAGLTQIYAQADMKETIAMIKKNLADSKQQIKKYEWVETTTTFLDGEQKVIFNITYSNLPDGTQYTGSTILEATTKKLKIVIENSGFKKAAGN